MPCNVSAPQDLPRSSEDLDTGLGLSRLGRTLTLRFGEAKRRIPALKSASVASQPRRQQTSFPTRARSQQTARILHRSANFSRDHGDCTASRRKAEGRQHDRLVSAYTKLSSSIDRAVKAYIEHTDAVIVGEIPLDASYLSQPFLELSSATQQLLVNDPQPALDGEDSKIKKKRSQKLRDPDAPKRPQTAYFLYMRDQRPLIAKELAEKNDGTKHAPGDVAKLGTERWNSLDQKSQQKYKDEYHLERIQYKEELRKYQERGGQLTPAEVKLALSSNEDIAAQDDDHEIPPAASKTSKKAVKGNGEDDEEDDDDSESTDSDDDEEEEPKAASLPAKTASKDVAKKTPKSALKKTTKAANAAGDIPPTPKFSSVNAPSAKFSSLDAAAPVASSSPERKRKRKSDVEAAPSSEPDKKKRGRKTNAEKAAAQLTEEQQKNDEEVPATATTAEVAPGSEKKKEKKERKKRKSLEA
nr:hmg box-containing protein c28f2.11 [Quercus suber]